jgi:hypothetical protein
METMETAGTVVSWWVGFSWLILAILGGKPPERIRKFIFINAFVSITVWFFLAWLFS